MYEKSFHTRPLAASSFLITGGAGFIGSHLVEYLLKHGAAKVRVLDNLLTGKMGNLAPFQQQPAFEFTEGDICDLATCEAACKGMDYVLHQAALGSVQRSMADPITTHQINVDGFLNMLWASKKEKIKRMVYASSSSVYGDHPALPKIEEQIGNPLSPYAVTKRCNELYAQVFAASYGMEIIGLRYFNVFGPRQNPEGPYAAVIPAFVRDIMNKVAPVIQGDGSNSRDFTFVENVVQANIRALFPEQPEALNQVYNVATGRQCTILQLCELIGKITGNPMLPQYAPPRPGDIKHSLADITKAKAKLGYEPEVFLEEGLRLLISGQLKTVD